MNADAGRGKPPTSGLGVGSPPGSGGAPGDGDGFVTPAEFKVILVGLVISLLLSALDNTIVGTAMPTIVGKLGGFSKAAWVSTAYVVTSTIATLVLGKLSDLYGRKRLFLFAIGSFLVASLLCGVSQNMNQLIFFRALQGIGGGGIWGLTFAIVGDLVPPRKRGNYFGIFSGVFALASVAGPLVGGLIVDQVSWRWIFYVNVPLGLLALFLVSKNLHLPRMKREVQVDYLGIGLVTVAIGALMVAIERGGEVGWDGSTVRTLFVVAALGAIAFVAWQTRAPEPLLPLRLFKNPVIRVTLLLSVFAGSVMMTVGWFFSFFFQDVRFYSPTKAGLSTLPIMLGMFTASTLTGRMITKLGRYKYFPMAGTPLLVLGLFLASKTQRDTSYAKLGFAMLITGLGMGLTMPAISIASQNSAEPRDLGIATSSANFFRSLGSSIGLAVFSTMFNGRVRSTLAAELPEGTASGNLLKIIRDPKRIEALPGPVRDAVTSGITAGVVRVFAVSALVAGVAFIVSVFVRDEPLRTQSGLARREDAVPAEAH